MAFPFVLRQLDVPYDFCDAETFIRHEPTVRTYTYMSVCLRWWGYGLLCNMFVSACLAICFLTLVTLCVCVRLRLTWCFRLFVCA